MAERTHSVLLLHGIRTQAEYAHKIAAVLQSDPEIRAVPIRYQFFDLLRFLVPFSRFRSSPIRRVTKLIRDELSREPAHISVIAHSFGTYIFTKILEKETDIQFHRVILCGGIVPDSFEWEKYAHRISDDTEGNWKVVNDCGMRDILPVIAKSVTWGYGSSGRFGFGHPRVKDRFFKARHSDYFKGDFVKNFWLPFLSKGEIVEGELDRATNPWWVSMLTIVKLKYVAIFAALLFALCLLIPDDLVCSWKKPTNIGVYFNGNLSREKEMIPLKTELANFDWLVNNWSTDTRGRTSQASGVNQIRFFSSRNKTEANCLLADLSQIDLPTGTGNDLSVVRFESPMGEARVELWLSN